MDLTTGQISSHIKQIAIPASMGFFFNTMFNVVDTYFAGWISTEALAALAISFPIFFIVIALVQGISTGSSALIANALGEGDDLKAERISAQIMTYAFFAYGMITPIGILASPTLFKILGATDNFLHMAISYMNIIFMGSLFLILIYAANSLLFARGNSIVLRNYLFGACLLNILLNPWFLFGGFGVPAMGIQGIALATVVSMALGLIYVLFKVIQGGYFRFAKFIDFIPDHDIFIEITNQSMPASINMITIGIGIFVINYFIKDFGRAALAAYGIATRIEQIVLLPTIGLSVAALTIIGQNNGARLNERIEETLKTSIQYGICVVLFGCIFLFFLPQALMKLFTDDIEVIKIGATYLRIASFTEASYVILGISVSALQGMKLPFYALWLGLFRQIIIPIGIFYVMTKVFGLGLLSVWWSIFAITWIAAIFTHWYVERVLKARRTD